MVEILADHGELELYLFSPNREEVRRLFGKESEMPVQDLISQGARFNPVLYTRRCLDGTAMGVGGDGSRDPRNYFLVKGNGRPTNIGEDATVLNRTYQEKLSKAS